MRRFHMSQCFAIHCALTTGVHSHAPAPASNRRRAAAIRFGIAASAQPRGLRDGRCSSGVRIATCCTIRPLRSCLLIKISLEVLKIQIKYTSKTTSDRPFFARFLFISH